MPSRTCPACGGKLETSREATASSGYGAGRSFALGRCRDCRTESLLDDPTDEPDELYEQGSYVPLSAGRDRVLEPFRRLLDRDRIRLLGSLRPNSRVIEVGAGKGRLVRALEARGHDPAGIDPSPGAVRAARARGANVEAVPIESAEFPRGEADLVVFWHVLEHLAEPREALVIARRWLAGNGRIVVAVPNRASLQARIGGDRWFHQDVPRHRTQFTADGLGILLERSGFGPTRTRHLMADQSLFGMWVTLLNRVTIARDIPFRALKRDLRYERRGDSVRDAIVAPIAGIALVPVALLLELAADAVRRGGTVVVEAGLA